MSVATKKGRTVHATAEVVGLRLVQLLQERRIEMLSFVMDLGTGVQLGLVEARLARQGTERRMEMLLLVMDLERGVQLRHRKGKE